MTTQSLVERAMQVDLAYTAARLAIIAEQPGNPFGVAIQAFGHATALAAAHLPSPRFNRLVGLTAPDAPLVPEILAWFGARKVSPLIEIRPGAIDATLAQALVQAGFGQTGFHATLFGPAMPRPALGADIRLVETPGMLEAILAAYLEGWDAPAEIHAGAKANMRGWLGLAGWRLYLASVAGHPAAAGILYIDQGIAYLADACVVPNYRRRGLHAALLAHRQTQAAGLGAQWICSQASFASSSHRNMERSGLQLLHTQSEWTVL